MPPAVGRGQRDGQVWDQHRSAAPAGPLVGHQRVVAGLPQLERRLGPQQRRVDLGHAPGVLAAHPHRPRAHGDPRGALPDRDGAHHRAGGRVDPRHRAVAAVGDPDGPIAHGQGGRPGSDAGVLDQPVRRRVDRQHPVGGGAGRPDPGTTIVELDSCECSKPSWSSTRAPASRVRTTSALVSHGLLRACCRQQAGPWAVHARSMAYAPSIRTRCVSWASRSVRRSRRRVSRCSWRRKPISGVLL